MTAFISEKDILVKSIEYETDFSNLLSREVQEAWQHQLLAICVLHSSDQKTVERLARKSLVDLVVRQAVGRVVKAVVRVCVAGTAAGQGGVKVGVAREGGV